MKKVTMQDLADCLGLSRVTVWKVLNGKPGVSEITCKRVLEKMTELNSKTTRVLPDGTVVPYGYAYGMGRQAPSHIGLLVSPGETSSFWMSMVNQIALELASRQMTLTYIGISKEEIADGRLPAILESKNIDGLLIMNACDEQEARLLATIQLPKVYLDGAAGLPFEELNGDMLLLDGRRSMFQITEQLMSAGRRRLGYFGDSMRSYSAQSRWQGFLEAHDRRGILLDRALCFTGPFTESGFQGASKLYLNGMSVLPDGIVCSDDRAAHWIMKGLAERGISVPDQIAVTGYDNNPDSFQDLGYPEIVKVQNGQVGERLIRQLLYQLENPDADHEIISISSRVTFLPQPGGSSLPPASSEPAGEAGSTPKELDNSPRDPEAE